MINLNWFKSQYRLGIYIGINGVSAALAEYGQTPIKWLKHIKIEYASSLNEANGYQSLQRALESVLDYFEEQLSRNYVPVQLALADTLVHSAVFEMDQIPVNKIMKNELLTMRFQKDCHINIKNTAIASQVMQDWEQKALYAIATPESLVSLIKMIFNQQYQCLHRVDKAIHYVFNYFYDDLVVDAAMLFCSDEYWTLIIWDSNKNVVYFRSRQSAQDEALNVVFGDVSRLLHTYQQNSQQQIKQLYIVDAGKIKSDFSKIAEHQFDVSVAPLSLNPVSDLSGIYVNESSLFVVGQR